MDRVGQHDNIGALADADAAAKLTPPGSLDNAQLLSLFERLHRPDRALALLEPVIALHKGDHVLGALLNARCWQRGLANVELDKALDDCNTAIRRDGPKPAYLDSRGLIHVRQKDYTAAIADYDAALSGRPNIAASLFMRGWAKRASGQSEAGIADMTAAKTADADIADYFQLYGFAE
jgi:tetratricopeptide (TPR) repeat protein